MAVGLHELNDFALSNVEALPIDRRILRRLGDGHSACAIANFRSSRRYGATYGQGADMGSTGHHEGNSQDFKREYCSGAYASGKIGYF